MRTRAVRGVAVLVAGACAFAGCGEDDSSPSSTEVRPFADVQASDLEFEADPLDPTRGIFRVTTSEPMICAIVWGEDDTFGRFNNSLSMNGTGIEQHDVTLPGIEPGATYQFVVQGTTADGTLYRSEVGTFRIGDESDRPPSTVLAPGTDIAPTSIVSAVSSEFSDAFAAVNAIDGDLATEWATSGDGDDGSITLELPEETEILAVDFVTRSMADGSATTSTYTVRVDDGPPLGPFPAGSPAQPRPAVIEVPGRTLRFDIVTSSGGNVGAAEIRVYA